MRSSSAWAQRSDRSPRTLRAPVCAAPGARATRDLSVRRGDRGDRRAARAGVSRVDWSYIASMCARGHPRPKSVDGCAWSCASPVCRPCSRTAAWSAWWGDRACMRQKLERVAPNDVAAFLRGDDELHRPASYLQPIFLEPPPDSRADARAGRRRARLGLRMRGERAPTSTGCRIPDRIAADFVERRSASDKLRRSISRQPLRQARWTVRPDTSMGAAVPTATGRRRSTAGLSRAM